MEKWQGLFWINNFDGDHDALYIFKILDRKLALNIYHGDYLQILYLQKRYLRLTDKKPLKVIQNLHFKRGIKSYIRDLVFLFISLHITSIIIK